MDAPRSLKLDSRPLYVRAVDAIRRLLESEAYRPGDKLPSEGELSNMLGISRTTLRMALGHLELQGAIIRRQGVGTFVAQPAPADLLGGLQTLQSIRSLAQAAGLDTESSRREVDVVPASAGWAGALEIEPGVPLNRVRFVISIDDLPIAFLNSLIPASLAKAEELVDASGSLLDFLNRRGNPSPAYTHSRIYAVSADRELADRLEIEPRAAVLHLAETYFSNDGQPVSLSMNYFVSERFGLYISRQIDS